MLKDEFYKYYLDQNYNCSECLIRACNDYFNLNIEEKDFKLFSAYGAGMQLGRMCGAINTCVAILSLMFVKEKAHESEDIRPVVTILMKKFMRQYGSFDCMDIKPQSFKPEIRCGKTIEFACDALEETIKEFKEKKASLL